MFIPFPKIGDRVQLKCNQNSTKGTFTKGHKFTVVGVEEDTDLPWISLQCGEHYLRVLPGAIEVIVEVPADFYGV